MTLLLRAARAATWVFLGACAVALIATTVFGVVIPDLVNAHTDLQILLGMLAAAGGVIAVGWLTLGLVLGVCRHMRRPKGL